MTVKEIIVNYLKKHGYDGLVNVDIECGCDIEDLDCCDNFHLDDCQPAYQNKYNAKRCKDCDNQYDCKLFENPHCMWLKKGGGK